MPRKAVNASRKASAKERRKLETRKLLAFDQESFDALDLMARDRMMTWQELADEAFRDLLRKHGRPIDLKDALKKSVRASKSRAD